MIYIQYRFQYTDAVFVLKFFCSGLKEPELFSWY